MTTIVNAYPYGPVSEEGLVVFEKRLGTSLPADYRAFLHQYNGGQPQPTGFCIKENSDGSGVNQFYGLHDGPRWFSIDGCTNAEWGVPSELLPIGDDGLGNLICIGSRGKYAGEIYFVDHDIHPYHEPDSFEGVTKIANSFSDFITSLYEEIYT